MASTLSAARVDRLRERLESASLKTAKASLNKIDDSRELIGRVIVRVRGIAGLSQKELAARLGHNGQAQVARWESGAERPHFDAIFRIMELQQPLVQAWAELAGSAIEITVRLKAGTR